MSFFAKIENAKDILRRNGRVSLGALKRELDLEDDALRELVEELVTVQQVARSEDAVLAWKMARTGMMPMRGVRRRP